MEMRRESISVQYFCSSRIKKCGPETEIQDIEEEKKKKKKY